MFNRADKAGIFALLWSIWGAAYEGPELAKTFIILIGVCYWTASLVFHFLDRNK